MIISSAFPGASRLATALVMSGLVSLQQGAAVQIKGLDPGLLLDAYAQGQHDEALTPVRQANRDRARTFRLQLVLRGSQWVHLVAADRHRRALAAAAFALEVERIRAERGEWTVSDEKDCAGRCVIEWGRALLQTRGAADEGERVWFLASIALAGGVRDWTFLQAPLSPPSPKIGERGHAHHALARFPDEARFRLARAVALASRHAVTGEMETPRDGARTTPVASGVVNFVPRAAVILGAIEQRRMGLFEYAKEAMETLVSDASVGDEARIRLGYLHWVRGDAEKALAAERAAAAATKDPDLKYVANFLAAQAAQALGDLAAAEAYYRAALGARPQSQSATLGLAALLYLRGEAREAHDLVEASRTGRPRDDDPWRMFLYGDFPRLPMLVAELRRLVAP